MSNINLNNNNRATTPSNFSSFNEKQETSSYYQPIPSPQPPTYGASPPPQPNWSPLCQATALYAYSSADAGDLELQPGDSISVTEYMNAEWWKGRSSRTGQEGIFPRSYVKVTEEKTSSAGEVKDTNTGTYGNVPLDGEFFPLSLYFPLPKRWKGCHEKSD